MKFRIEHVENMIFIVDDYDQVWKAWDEREFTERKLANAMRKIQSGYNTPVSFERTF